MLQFTIGAAPDALRAMTVAATLLILGCASTGCASTPPAPAATPVATTQLAQAAPANPPAASSSDGEAVPDVNLSGALLYQLMAAEAAAQRGELGAAYAIYLKLARETRDPRLARRATELGLQGRALPQALEAAERADACLFALLLQDVALLGAVPRDLAALARAHEPLAARWGGGTPSGRLADVVRAALQAGDDPRAAREALSGTGDSAALAGSLVGIAKGAAAEAAPALAETLSALRGRAALG
jgi:hypothetical protein